MNESEKTINCNRNPRYRIEFEAEDEIDKGCHPKYLIEEADDIYHALLVAWRVVIRDYPDYEIRILSVNVIH